MWEGQGWEKNNKEKQNCIGRRKKLKGPGGKAIKAERLKTRQDSVDSINDVLCVCERVRVCLRADM